eukprot:m.151420 g.151420  ORF g.151420 m.151420 type:complete len:1267 (-) comp14292_c0_seq1:770-4570(-)
MMSENGPGMLPADLTDGLARKEHNTSVGILYDCVSGSDKGWTAITDGYVSFHVTHSEEFLRAPYTLTAPRTETFDGFEFEILKSTRARRTKPTFLQWHRKGSKHNYGLQLINEEQAIALEKAFFKAINYAKANEETNKEKEHRLLHLNRTGQTAEAFQLLDAVAKRKASHMMKVHLPDASSSMFKVGGNDSLSELLERVCEVTRLDSTAHTLSRMDGTSISSGELDGTSVTAYGKKEIRLTASTAHARTGLPKVGAAATALSSDGDAYISVHLPDGGSTVVRIPKSSSMAELLIMICEKRSVDIKVVQMAADPKGKLPLSLNGSILANGITDVYIVNRRSVKSRKPRRGFGDASRKGNSAAAGPSLPAVGLITETPAPAPPATAPAAAPEVDDGEAELFGFDDDDEQGPSGSPTTAEGGVTTMDGPRFEAPAPPPTDRPRRQAPKPSRPAPPPPVKQPGSPVPAKRAESPVPQPSPRAPSVKPRPRERAATVSGVEDLSISPIRPPRHSSISAGTTTADGRRSPVVPPRVPRSVSMHGEPQPPKRPPRVSGPAFSPPPTPADVAHAEADAEAFDEPETETADADLNAAAEEEEAATAEEAGATVAEAPLSPAPRVKAPAFPGQPAGLMDELTSQLRSIRTTSGETETTRAEGEYLAVAASTSPVKQPAKAEPAEERDYSPPPGWIPPPPPPAEPQPPTPDVVESPAADVMAAAEAVVEAVAAPVVEAVARDAGSVEEPVAAEEAAIGGALEHATPMSAPSPVSTQPPPAVVADSTPAAPVLALGASGLSAARGTGASSSLDDNDDEDDVAPPPPPPPVGRTYFGGGRSMNPKPQVSPPTAARTAAPLAPQPTATTSTAPAAVVAPFSATVADPTPLEVAQPPPTTVVRSPSPEISRRASVIPEALRHTPEVEPRQEPRRPTVMAPHTPPSAPDVSAAEDIFAEAEVAAPAAQRHKPPPSVHPRNVAAAAPVVTPPPKSQQPPAAAAPCEESIIIDFDDFGPGEDETLSDPLPPLPEDSPVKSVADTTPPPPLPPDSPVKAPATSVPAPSVVPRRPAKSLVKAALSQTGGLPPPPTEAAPCCVTCSAHLAAGAKFCAECGCAVGDTSFADLPPPPPLDIDALPPPPPVLASEPSPVKAVPPPVVARFIPPPPPPLPAPAVARLAAAPVRSGSLVDVISSGAFTLRKTKPPAVLAGSRAVDPRAALLASLGELGQGRARLKKTAFPRNNVASASAMETAIAMALNNRRSAVTDNRESILSDQTDDDWE